MPNYLRLDLIFTLLNYIVYYVAKFIKGEDLHDEQKYKITLMINLFGDMTFQVGNKIMIHSMSSFPAISLNLLCIHNKLLLVCFVFNLAQ